VLVHDRLVADELVSEAPPGAIRVPRATLRQEEVNELLVAYGRRGLLVVRLKGGDPFVFGRGGEEALALGAAGIPFVVVPGVSALSSVPACAGIPITHRGVSSQVTVVSGSNAEHLDWPALAQAPGTLVFFMALGRLAEIAAALLGNGRAPETAAAVIAEGSLLDQRTVVAPLIDIAEAAKGVAPPALVVVGDVVRLSALLAGRLPEAVVGSAA
jgi:uroporphyrin-III C-methyltransferase